MMILSTAMNAVMNQMDRLTDSASRVAKIGLDIEGEEPVDLAQEVVVRIEAEGAIRANLSVIRNEDERLSHLIDTIL